MEMNFKKIIGGNKMNWFLKKKTSLHITVLLALILLLAGCQQPVQNTTTASEPAESTQEPTEAATIEFDYETDVVVVGGGGAGLVSALTAAENGAKVILLEKMGYMGGATIMSGGIVPASGTKFQEDAGIVDNVEMFARDIFRPAHYSQRSDLVYTVAENAAGVIDWMEELGVKWELITSFLYHGQSNYRMHRAEGQGAGMTGVLIDRVNENTNITVMLETPGVGLITDDSDAVIGVKATTPDGNEINIGAPATILCTSGFAANKEMLEEYIPSIVNAYPMVAPGATGEGIMWGAELGAELKHMDAYQGYAPYSEEIRSGLDLFILYRGGILINNNTERFTNEHMGYSELSPHVVNQPDHYAWMIFDQTNAERTAALDTYEEKEILIKAESIEELASAVGLDADKLVAIVDEFRDGMASGEDRFNRTLLPEAFEAPFYAIKVTGDLRHTQGGLVTDTQARVLREDGTSIPGLFAAGGVAEGFSSAGGPGYMSGNGLLQAFVFGRIAGQEATK